MWVTDAIENAQVNLSVQPLLRFSQAFDLEVTCDLPLYAPRFDHGARQRGITLTIESDLTGVNQTVLLLIT
ncbi:hypothetical protein D3C73_1551830 [compost metagenome]